MFRINYLPTERMPLHQGDFARREQLEELPGSDGSRALALMVAWYLVAMFAGILLLGHLTAPRPNTSTAATSGALSK